MFKNKFKTFFVKKKRAFKWHVGKSGGIKVERFGIWEGARYCGCDAGWGPNFALGGDGSYKYELGSNLLAIREIL